MSSVGSASWQHGIGAARVFPSGAGAALPKLNSVPRSDVFEIVRTTSPAALRVGRTWFHPCTLRDLRPGDIGFQYLRSGRNFRQMWIGVGNRIANRLYPAQRADPSVLHAFIVEATDLRGHAIACFDAAGGNFQDITRTRLDFCTGERVVRGAKYVFYRPTDARIGRRIVSVASNWSAPDLHNFSKRHAVASPFRGAAANPQALGRALWLADQAERQHPVCVPQTGKLYRMMCSEFVANVCVAVALLVWRDTHRLCGHDRRAMLAGLYQGPFGQAFAVDTRGLTPALLQRLLESSPGWRPVGCLDEPT